MTTFERRTRRLAIRYSRRVSSGVCCVRDRNGIFSSNFIVPPSVCLSLPLFLLLNRLLALTGASRNHQLAVIGVRLGDFLITRSRAAGQIPNFNPIVQFIASVPEISQSHTGQAERGVREPERIEREGGRERASER